MPPRLMGTFLALLGPVPPTPIMPLVPVPYEQKLTIAVAGALMQVRKMLSREMLRIIVYMFMLNLVKQA